MTNYMFGKHCMSYSQDIYYRNTLKNTERISKLTGVYIFLIHVRIFSH